MVDAHKPLRAAGSGAKRTPIDVPGGAERRGRPTDSERSSVRPSGKGKFPAEGLRGGPNFGIWALPPASGFETGFPRAASPQGFSKHGLAPGLVHLGLERQQNVQEGSRPSSLRS